MRATATSPSGAGSRRSRPVSSARATLARASSRAASTLTRVVDRPMRRIATSLLLVAALAAPARANVLEVPPEGSCSPRPLQWTSDAVPPATDVVPPAFKPGEKIEMKSVARLQGWLPDEVWERRQKFFFEGMELEIGPCYRRFPVPAYFTEATRANSGHATLDAATNLLGYTGAGLPFAPASLDGEGPELAARLAWDYRYRYSAASTPGRFRRSPAPARAPGPDG